MNHFLHFYDFMKEFHLPIQVQGDGNVWFECVVACLNC